MYACLRLQFYSSLAPKHILIENVCVYLRRSFDAQMMYMLAGLTSLY